jgi:hypothetical protein
MEASKRSSWRQALMAGGLVLGALGLTGCVPEDAPQVVCGANTVLDGLECRGQPPVTCGAGTTLENGACRATPTATVTCGAGTTLQGAECRPTPPPGLALPLAVDSQFAASGYMGSGAQGGITDDENCPNRPAAAVGKCHHFTLTKRTDAWGGVFWQYPAGNWGESGKGLLMQPTGTKVTFKAWGAAGGEKVKFLVGIPSADGFEKVLDTVTLTQTPTLYTVDLSRVRYAEVVGGFGWAADAGDAPVHFYVDDIQWQ